MTDTLRSAAAKLVSAILGAEARMDDRKAIDLSGYVASLKAEGRIDAGLDDEATPRDLAVLALGFVGSRTAEAAPAAVDWMLSARPNDGGDPILDRVSAVLAGDAPQKDDIGLIVVNRQEAMIAITHGDFRQVTFTHPSPDAIPTGSRAEFKHMGALEGEALSDAAKSISWGAPADRPTF